jgi:hypothetical protein
VSALVRLVGGLLIAYLILTVWAAGPAAGLHLLNHWFDTVKTTMSHWDARPAR